MLEPEGTASFKQRMLRSGRETARRALEPKPKPKKKELPPLAAPQNQLSVLSEILAFLKNYQAAHPTAGAASFVVTERDAEGKIKSFKVKT
mgnify:CR=1 FL=1